MPHLVKWNDELKDFGLVVVGPHVQGGSADAIEAKARSLGVNFTVTNGGSVKGITLSGIPDCVVFDHSGACIFRGNPLDAEKHIRPAVGKALLAALNKTTLSKGITPIADALKKGQAPISLLPKAVALQKSTDATTAEEAKLLVAKMTEPGQKRVDEAESIKKDDPLSAYLALEPVPAAYKGTPVATKASALLTELRKEKPVSAELKARPSLDRVKKLEEQLKPLASKYPTSDPSFKKLAAAQLKQLQSSVQLMKKSYPDARATQQAVAIADKYGVTIK